MELQWGGMLLKCRLCIFYVACYAVSEPVSYFCASKQQQFDFKLFIKLAWGNIFLKMLQQEQNKEKSNEQGYI